jgi:adenosylcobinamide-phosphate synthase
MLDREALAIGERLGAGDLDGARLGLRSLVGRRPDDLDEGEISRAVIESVAENTVDAVTASAMWAVIGGAPAVFAHRAINTLDAMVGHHDDRYEHFGWASARLDDAAAWIPARLTTALVLAPMALRRGGSALVRTVRRQAAAHPSPNGGLIEAAYAHRLGITLGGANRYGDRIEDRGILGTGPAPGPADIARAVALRRRIGTSIATAGVAVGLIARIRRARTSRRRSR